MKNTFYIKALRNSTRAVSIGASIWLSMASGAQAQTQTQTALSAAEIRIIDQRGVELKLAAPAQRVVAIPVPMASIVMALDGSSRRVVGMHPVAKTSIEDGLLKKIYPQSLAIASDITRGGMFNPNMETVLALRPDLVVAWSEPLEAVQTMERAGLTVLTLRNDPPNLQAHFGNLDKLAKALGLQARLAALRTDIEAKQARAQKAVAGLPAIAATPPRALYLQQAKTAMRASGNNTFQDFWITQSGAKNVAGALAGHQPQTTMEQIIAWDPEIIFLGTFDAATPAEIYANPSLANVAAVRNKRVYKLPHGGYRWDPGNHESGLMLLWAASVTHPSLPHMNLRSEMRSTYEAIYRYALTDDEIDEILQIRLNAGSAGYSAKFSR
jgi:iron complex transport system substrate-binding protein